MDKWKYENDKMVAVGTVTRDIQQAIDKQNKIDGKVKKSLFNIAKADEDQRLVFGWALVAQKTDGETIIDHQGDMVDPDELEKGAYEYVLKFRDAGEEHLKGLRKKAKMVESCVFTPEKMKAIGIPEGTIPVGWWIGFYVDDDKTWELIKNGTYQMFSIEGKAIREPVDEPVTKSSRKSLIDRWLEDESPFRIMKENVSKSFLDIMKFNENHDNLGRFASGSGGAATSNGNGLSPEHQRIAQLLSTGSTRDNDKAHEYRKENKLSIFSPEWKAIREEADRLREENQKTKEEPPKESKKPKIDPKKVEEAKRAREAEIQQQESEIQKQCNVSKEKAKEYREDLEEWTGGTYSDIRAYQQGKTVDDSENISRMSNNLEEMIGKSSGYGGGTLYRGIMVDDSTLSALKAGNEVNMGGTSSFSTSQKMAEDFAMGGGTGKNSVVLVTDSASKAMNIEPIFKSGENEVLVSKDVKYVSKKISKKGNVYYVYMDEITGAAKSYSGAVAKTFAEILKYNPNHDNLGRFSSGSGGAGGNVISFPSSSSNTGNSDKWNYPGIQEATDKIESQVNNVKGQKQAADVYRAIKQQEQVINRAIEDIENGTENGDMNILLTQRRRLRMAQRKLLQNGELG